MTLGRKKQASSVLQRFRARKGREAGFVYAAGRWGVIHDARSAAYSH